MKVYVICLYNVIKVNCHVMGKWFVDVLYFSELAEFNFISYSMTIWKLRILILNTGVKRERYAWKLYMFIKEEKLHMYTYIGETGFHKPGLLTFSIADFHNPPKCRQVSGSLTFYVVNLQFLYN